MSNAHPLRSILLAVVFAVGLLPVAAAFAAADSDTQEFAKKAASGGLLEVRLGELASRNASSPEVKAFAQRMVNDHSKANQELKAEAQRAGITLPTEPDDDDAEMLDKYKGMTGAEFDREYMDAMVSDHEKDVKLFRNESQRTDSPLHGFAAKTLPTLESHLEQARKVQKSLASTADAR